MNQRFPNIFKSAMQQFSSYAVFKSKDAVNKKKHHPAAMQTFKAR